MPEAAITLQGDPQTEHQARIERARTLRRQGVTIDPAAARPDNPRVVEVVPPPAVDPVDEALETAHAGPAAPAPRAGPRIVPRTLEDLLEENPYFEKLWREGKAILLEDLQGYPWELNIRAGDHPSRGDAYRAALVEFKGVKGIVEISFGPVTFGGTINSQGNVEMTGAGGTAVPLGKLSGGASCDVSAGCSGSVTMPLGGGGEVSVDPTTDTITIFIGPTVNVGAADVKAGIKGEAGVSRDTARDIIRDAVRNVTGDVPPAAPDPNDPTTWTQEASPKE